MVKFKEVIHIPLDDLEIGMGQVRLKDVGKGIDELTDSIRKVGLLEPIVVCESETPGKFEIITGQRRFLAHKELGKETIWAAIMDERVDEMQAKILSVTENLIRRNLHSSDLVDVCTELYLKYGSIKAVCEETGLPYNKVSDHVKYVQLIPELKSIVKDGTVEMKTALKAQKAASVSGTIDPNEAIELAIEMAPMSNATQKNLVRDREKNPNKPVDEAIEHAKTGGKITQLSLLLTSNVHGSLQEYADAEGASAADAASELIEFGLSNKGFLDDK